MKKTTLIIIFILWFIQITYAKECNNIDDIYKKYSCHVKEVCDQKYKNPKINPLDNKIHFETTNFENADRYKDIEEDIKVFLRVEVEQKEFKKSINIYKENMNWLYRCSLLRTQYNSLNKLQKKLKQNAKVKADITDKIDEYLRKIEIKMTSSEYKCKNIDKNEPYQKLQVLREATHQTCKFRFYMNYLSEYYEKTANLVKKEVEKTEKSKENEYTINEIEKNLSLIQKAILEEINASYKVFPLAFAWYQEYENNFPIHILLLIIKQDYIVLRDMLHATLNPLNQVWYKIINAMSK